MQSDTDHVRTVCRKALIGIGEAEMEILFPSGPVPVKSELLVLNGGRRGGATILYLHVYNTVPAPAPIVTKVKVKEVNEGFYGFRALATIPKIAEGSGSIVRLDLRLRRRILSATCPPDRRLQFQFEPRFADDTRVRWTFVNFCERRP